MKTTNTDILLSFINRARFAESNEDLYRELKNIETCLSLFEGEVLEGRSK